MRSIASLKNLALIALSAATALATLWTVVRLRERPEFQGRGAEHPYRAFRDVIRNPHARLLLLVFGIESLGAATGAEFSVLPPQNATGNWIKVVQRVPIRIRLKPNEQEHVLRAGMSATVEIDTRANAIQG